MRVPVDYAFLKTAAKPVGIAIRIDAFRGGSIRDADAAGFTGMVVADALAAARSNGVQVAEVQIDCDCAESRLAEYFRMIKIIKPRIAPVPLIITALPCWLDAPDFAMLMGAVDGFVLQVHSLEQPKATGTPMRLCDPDRAARWARQAGRLGVPFRVALPTYGYRAAFAPDGRLLGISAEGAANGEGVISGEVEIRSDPVALAGLVKRWMADPPPNMTGVMWYRLPVPGERLNWKWETLAMVMRGKVPERKITVQIIHPEPSLAEVEIINKGLVDDAPASTIVLGWEGKRLIGADGLAGFECTRKGEDRAMLQFPTNAPPVIVGAGDHLKIGWLRFDQPAVVKVVDGE
jgi:hypothetical protein